MSVPFAIPIHAKIPENPELVAVGTGFIAIVAGKVYLMTAAHVPLSEKRPRENQFHRWPRNISTHLPGGGEVEIPLFDDEGRAKFGYRVIAHEQLSEPELVDVIWVQLPPQHPLSKAYGYFQIEAGAPAAGGTIAHAYGFPGAPPWPVPVSVVDGQILPGGDGIRITADLRVTAGYSGGPIVDDDTNLIGLTNGHIDGVETPATLVPASTIYQLITGA